MRHQSEQRGSILVTVLLMMSVLALLVAAVANDSLQTMRTVSQSGRDTQAKYVAYAGLEYALHQLRVEDDFVGEEISERHGSIRDGLENLDDFEYEVFLWNNMQDPEEGGSDDAESLIATGDVEVSANTVYLISSGINTDRGEEVILTSMSGTARRVRPVFADGAFARTKLALQGPEGAVDAWNSSLGMGGFEAYQAPTNGNGNGNGNGGGSPGNVLANEATLGTDSSTGRTLRLLNGAQLNGHYRVGPGTDIDRAFGLDGGTSSSTTNPRTGSSERVYAVTTAQTEDQVAGSAPSAPDAGDGDKVVVDSKETEVPRFTAPYSEDDCIAPPPLNNPDRPQVDRHGDPVEDNNGNQIIDPPAPVELPINGYTSLTVPEGQTLQLSAGVYFFRDELRVEGGSIITRGDGPTIIFCGKKATFIDAEINSDRSTSQLQLCFTDDEKGEEATEAAAGMVADVLAGTPGAEDMDDFMNLISPRIDASEPERRGFSLLEIQGSTKLHGSVSGENLVANMQGGEVFGAIMGNVVRGSNAKLHQDLALKGSNLMNAGGWLLEDVQQLR